MTSDDALGLMMPMDPLDLAAGARSGQHWRSLLGQVGGEVASVLARASERVHQLTTTGKIDRSGLRQLREEIERARRIGILAQRLMRLASEGHRQPSETVSLTQMSRDVLIQRGSEISARSIDLHQAMAPSEILTDPATLHALLHAVLDWVLEQSPARLDLRIDHRPWPPRAYLRCEFSALPPQASLPGEAAARPAVDRLDNLSWRLVQQLAWSMQLGIERVDSAHGAVLTLDFPQTVDDPELEADAPQHDFGTPSTQDSKPLAGTHLLVMAGRRELKADIRAAVRHMGMLVDYVSSVSEAEAFCREARPHGMIFESALAGDRFNRLRSSLSQALPDFVFIEISEEGRGFELSGNNGRHHAVVGRDVVLDSLTSALIFEFSHTH